MECSRLPEKCELSKCIFSRAILKFSVCDRLIVIIRTWCFSSHNIGNEILEILSLYTNLSMGRFSDVLWNIKPIHSEWVGTIPVDVGGITFRIFSTIPKFCILS